MKKFFIFLIVLSVVMISGNVFSNPAKKVFINAAVYTMNFKNPRAEAVVIENNKFVYVGNTKGAKKYIDKETTVFDLKGRMVLPGLIESHMHPSMGSMFLGIITLNQDLNKEELLRDIRKGVAEKQEEPVIAMMGFKADVFGPEGPKASDLDSIESNKPVIILDYGGHSGMGKFQGTSAGRNNKGYSRPGSRGPFL